MVPATSSTVPTTGVPATNPAGTNPTPMTVDDGIFYQPVRNNPTYINEGKIDLFRLKPKKGIARSWSNYPYHPRMNIGGEEAPLSIH